MLASWAVDDVKRAASSVALVPVPMFSAAATEPGASTRRSAECSSVPVEAMSVAWSAAAPARAAARALEDEGPHGVAGVAAEGAPVGRAGDLLGRLLEALGHPLAGLLQQLLRLGGVHPPARDDLRPRHDFAGLGVDRGHHDDH